MSDIREIIAASLARAEQARSPEAIAARKRQRYLDFMRESIAQMEHAVDLQIHNATLSRRMLFSDAAQNDLGVYWFWLQSAFEADMKLDELLHIVESFLSFYPELNAELLALRARIEAKIG